MRYMNKISEFSDKQTLKNNNSIETLNNKIQKDNPVQQVLRTTETNMHVDLLANSEKLITEDRRWKYEDGMPASERKPLHQSQPQIPKKEQNPAKTETKPNIFSKKQDNENNFSAPASETQKKQEEPPMTEEELLLKKLDMLRKLAELAQSGVKLSQNYNMQSDYKTMCYEYKLHKDIRAKTNGVNWMSSMYLNLCYGLEMANEKYNPFDLKLSKWSEQINADINSYYDVFGEIYDKYNEPGKNMAPELKLLLMMSGSAIKFHLTNTMMSNMPMLGKTPADVTEQMRQKALADNNAKMREQAMRNNAELSNYANKDHAAAAQRIADLNMLKQRDMEQINMQRELAQKKADMERMHERLAMSTPVNNYAQPTMQAPKDVQILLDKNKQNDKMTKEQEKIAQMYQQSQTELYKKQLETLEAQKKATEMAGIRMQQEYVSELQKIQKLKKEDEKARASEKSKDKKDIISIDSDNSIMMLNNDLDEILDKSKDNINKKLEQASLSDSRIKKVDVLDNDEISVGGKSKKSSGSKTSNKSSKTSVGSKKVKNTKIGIDLFD